MLFWVSYGDALTGSPPRIRGPSSRPQACLLVSGPALPLQPGVDVDAPVAGGAADPDERRPGAFLPPPLKGTQADLQLVGELLLGEELARSCAPWSVWPSGFSPADRRLVTRRRDDGGL